MSESIKHPIDILLRNTRKQPLKFVKTIVEVVCGHSGITVNQVQLKDRKREIVGARQIAMALSKKMTTGSLAKIGYEVGKKDHATVLHAVRTVENLYDTERETRYKIDKIIQVLQQRIFKLGLENKKDMLVCQICGGSDIEMIAYIDPNTQKYLRKISGDQLQYSYCNTCQANVNFIKNIDYKNHDGEHSMETVPSSL